MIAVDWIAVGAVMTGTAALATATYALLVWRQLADTRTARVRLRDELAAERAVRAIVAFENRPGDPYDPTREVELYTALEVERQVLSDRTLAGRMWVTTVFLQRSIQAVRTADLSRLHELVARIVESCNAQLLASWRDEGLPTWVWNDPSNPNDGPYAWPEGSESSGADAIVKWIDAVRSPTEPNEKPSAD